MADERLGKPQQAYRGFVERVETGTTGSALNRQGLSILSTAGVYTLPTPTRGIVKTLSITATGITVQTHSSGTIFTGSTFNSVTTTTDLNGPEGIQLIGASTAAWAVASPTGAGLSLQASTQA